MSNTFNITYTGNPEPVLDLPPLSVDNSSTSLFFHGHGVPNFGPEQQNNFLKLLQNFAAPSNPPNPRKGQIWYDTSMDIVKYWTGTIWKLVSASATSAGSTSPDNPTEGQLWYEIAANRLWVFNGSEWVIPTGCRADVGPVPPENPGDGQLWYDTNLRYLKVYNASAGGWALCVDPAFQYLALLM
jgi:hypothetical protein